MSGKEETTIRVSRIVVAELRKHGISGESLDKILRKLLGMEGEK